MRYQFLLAFILLTNSFCVSSSTSEAHNIKIITNNWTSQIVLSYITGNIFEKMGYPVTYQ
ncbi:MAG: hypothetical protein GY787_15640 [Alteromonadales bacterium]|nr:hypothetical protein [Alteromonadales bacterium]